MNQMKENFDAMPLREVLLEHQRGPQWQDNHTQRFTKQERSSTTVITNGMPDSSMFFLKSVFSSIGIKLHPLLSPTNSALQIGKEYGNRGQCNPTYYTVGSLIEYLIHLRDVEGVPTREIVANYLFVTMGGCGPCRMGMYATEYRKALRDSGFGGFRVLLLSRSGEASLDSTGIAFSKIETMKLFSCAVMGDIVNILEKKIRPYEVEEGATDAAIQKVTNIIADAYANKKSLILAAWKSRKVLASVKVDALQLKPKVLVQGEFWAKTNEGDGNYNLYRFLEEEGAEVMIESISDWLLHQIWQAKWAIQRREDLAFHDTGGDGLKGQNMFAKKVQIWMADRLIRVVFKVFSLVLGLKQSVLSDHGELASAVEKYFNLEVNGGEDHMEVAHHIHTFEHNLANMVLSVKPFTCLSSSGVSDGVQPLISEKYPNSIFVAVETSGDASANFYSRVQMQLFKAKQAAESELEEALEEKGLSLSEAKKKIEKCPTLSSSLFEPKGKFACRSANVVSCIS